MLSPGPDFFSTRKIFFSSILHIILVVEKCSVRLSIFYIFMSILFLLTLATIFFSQKFLFVRP
jgi:hypothetical protein